MRIKVLTPLLALVLLAAPLSALALSSSSATHEARGLIHALATGHYASPQKTFSQSLKQAFTPKTLRSEWHAITKRLGAFKSLGKSRVTSSKDHTIVLVHSRFSKSAAVFRVVINGAGKIAGFSVRPASGRR